MLILFLIIAPIYIVYKVLKSYWISNKILKAQFKIMSLNDKLKWAAINNKVNTDDEMYKYLDKTLKVAPAALKNLNFWTTVYLMHKHKRDVLEDEIDIISTKIAGKEYLNVILEEYKQIFLTTIIKKSFATIILLRPVWISIMKYVAKRDQDHYISKRMLYMLNQLTPYGN